ncbi:protein TBATA-like isoform X2 [Dreissena polymorpha]|uniref:protein TBATA-like isoform X2 n=1 Tax=Dreissena polymorpha TaxID=45954 RepID=UPI0022654FE2|nr:protein TBATA-like isoform X2 [Dreissena polymorpha]
MADVFVPSQGNLVTRSALNEGVTVPVDSYRKPTTANRPSTQGGYRFGQLSQNSFFTRHNPHPMRVRHLKGLLDVPICAVNDDGYFANPRYSLQFPPNYFNQKKLQRIPVNAINVNSQMHPINTVTGLQYFTGLTNYPFRERAVPKVGMVPVTETWRDELKALTDAIQQNASEQKPEENKLPERPKTQYSETTGRLIPPPSRAMSRGPSRQASRQGSRQGGRDVFQRNFQHIAEDPDMEAQVMVMLCQILQTEDINAVKAWLCSAGEQEKTMVMNMIRTAIGSKEDYYRRDFQPEYINEENNVVKLPPINEKDDGKPKTINRLTMEENGSEKLESWKQPAQPVGATWSPGQSQALEKPLDSEEPLDFTFFPDL